MRNDLEECRQGQHDGRINKTSFFIALVFVLFYQIPTYAQGQGSWGGGGGLAAVFLLVILIVLVGLLFLVGKAFGAKAVLIAVLAIIAWYAYDQHQLKRQQEAYVQVLRGFAQGCTETTRTVFETPKGDEQVYLRMTGEQSIHSSDRSSLAPNKDKMGKGVELVATLPKTVRNGIAVDLAFKREVVPGSLKGHEWLRTRYELIAKTIPEGRTVAHTIDMGARHGFCLDHLEPFLRKALNRNEVLFTGSYWQKSVDDLPDSYVRGIYGAVSRGEYFKSKSMPRPDEEAKGILIANGCTLGKSERNGLEAAFCKNAESQTIEIAIVNSFVLYRGEDFWLFAYRNDDLTSARIELRDKDWQRKRVWLAHMLPPQGFQGYPAKITAFQADTLLIEVYSKHKTDLYDENYDKSVVQIPLPGIQGSVSDVRKK